MSTDDDIREAFGRMAQRTPDPERTRQGIAAKSRAHKQRRLLLVGAGALTVGAAVPAFLLSRGKPGLPPDAVADLLRKVPGRGFPMPFTPAWIPENFDLSYRVVATDSPGWQERHWVMRATGDEYGSVRLRLSPGVPGEPKGPTTEVEVNGIVAKQDQDGGHLTWQPVSGLTLNLQVNLAKESAATALRIARSMTKDAVEYVPPTVHFGWLPPAARGQRSYLEGYGVRAAAVLPPDPDGDAQVLAMVSREFDTDWDMAKAEHTTLLGKPASYFRERAPDGESLFFWVQLAEDRWLAVGATVTPDVAISKEEIVRVAETVRID